VARLKWFRNADAADRVADETTFERLVSCPNARNLNPPPQVRSDGRCDEALGDMRDERQTSMHGPSRDSFVKALRWPKSARESECALAAVRAWSSSRSLTSDRQRVVTQDCGRAISHSWGKSDQGDAGACAAADLSPPASSPPRRWCSCWTTLRRGPSGTRRWWRRRRWARCCWRPCVRRRFTWGCSTAPAWAGCRCARASCAAARCFMGLMGLGAGF
jgi:hypothetical protein